MYRFYYLEVLLIQFCYYLFVCMCVCVWILFSISKSLPPSELFKNNCFLSSVLIIKLSYSTENYDFDWDKELDMKSTNQKVSVAKIGRKDHTMSPASWLICPRRPPCTPLELSHLQEKFKSKDKMCNIGRWSPPAISAPVRVPRNEVNDPILPLVTCFLLGKLGGRPERGYIQTSSVRRQWQSCPRWWQYHGHLCRHRWGTFYLEQTLASVGEVRDLVNCSLYS